MLIYDLIIAGLWIVLIVYWGISAFSAKRSISSPWSWAREIAGRIALLILILVVLRFLALNRLQHPARTYLLNTSLPLGILGATICALGVGLAIWARAKLGRNWGTVMSQKESPELVTSGPYAYIRHPIYAGFLLAALGSAIGLSLIWVIPLIWFGVYFTHGARREEELMLKVFPVQYASYMKRTKRLIPFVW